jgi:cardiolipin synthase
VMQALLDAVVELVGLIPPTKVRLIATALKGLGASGAAPSVTKLADTPAGRAAVKRVLAAWARVNANGDEVAGMLLGSSAARQRVEQELAIELVWTGPKTEFVPTRRTEQVLLDLIASAGRELFLVSFVAYGVDSVVTALNAAASRGVRLRFLLEASTSQGGTLDYDPAAVMHGAVPKAELFTWVKRPKAFVGGKVHAKVVVVDGSRAFITSANLSGHALEKNMEAGVLINGGSVPKTLNDHLQALVDVGSIGRV